MAVSRAERAHDGDEVLRTETTSDWQRLAHFDRDEPCQCGRHRHRVYVVACVCHQRRSRTFRASSTMASSRRGREQAALTEDADRQVKPYRFISSLGLEITREKSLPFQRRRLPVSQNNTYLTK